MKRITDRYGPQILRETVGTKVSPALVAAVISVESAGQEAAVSHAGAVGLMQLMPATAERFGVTDRTLPAQSIKGGVAYLNWLMAEFGEDPLLILAGYNAGEGAVMKHEGVPPFAETRAYVPKVLAAFQVASGLCLNPPQFISDPCVFLGPS
jgi:soluble lytic murein transglycosylase-like protein